MAPINFGMALNIFQFLRLGMGTATLPQPKPSKFIYQGLSLFQLWTKPHMASGPRMGFTGNKLEWVPTSEMVAHAKVEWPGSNPVAVPLKVLQGHTLYGQNPKSFRQVKGATLLYPTDIFNLTRPCCVHSYDRLFSRQGHISQLHIESC